MPAMSPQARVVLDAIIATFPQVDRGTPTEARARSAAARAARPSPEPPTPVDRVSEHEVPVDGATVPVRLYRGRADASLGLLIFAHGGGWVTGDLDSHDELCRTLAVRAGIAVASVDYRLAPEHPFPAGLTDLDGAARWLVARTDEPRPRRRPRGHRRRQLGRQPGRGGGAAPHDRSGPAYRLQWLVYPALDPACDSRSHVDNGRDYFLTSDAMRWYWGHYLSGPEDASDPLASPLAAPDLQGLPPAFVLSAELDPLRDEGERYAAALSRAGVEVELRRAPGLFHGFLGLSKVLPEAEVELATAVDALVRALAPSTDDATSP